MLMPGVNGADQCRASWLAEKKINVLDNVGHSAIEKKSYLAPYIKNSYAVILFYSMYSFVVVVECVFV